MKDSDYSREIFEKFFSAKRRILKITLKDDTVLEGVFISFFHGDNENIDEPYITRWHFVDESEIQKPDRLISMDGGEEYGKIIQQEDIKDVQFKE